jgi:hypothetical protein
MEISMQRLISLFVAAEHEPSLSRPGADPPPGPPPNYDRDPEYFQHLLAYLREQKRAQDVQAASDAEGVLA